jgi:rhodanese-related sulfurtransferase
MKEHPPGFLKIVDESKKHIREISIQEVVEKQSRGEAFFFVDVREDREWNEGRARGAIHVGKGVIERDIEAIVSDPNAEVILYCGGGFRSALAAESLLKMGYKNILSMAGGIRAWREAELPIEKN